MYRYCNLSNNTPKDRLHYLIFTPSHLHTILSSQNLLHYLIFTPSPPLSQPIPAKQREEASRVAAARAAAQQITLKTEIETLREQLQVLRDDKESEVRDPHPYFVFCILYFMLMFMYPFCMIYLYPFFLNYLD